MATTVVNIRTDQYDVYIGRAGKGQDGYFGNPFRIGAHGDRANVLKLYRNHFIHRLESEPGFRERIQELRGKRLGCFCKPNTCHGDVIVEYLEG